MDLKERLIQYIKSHSYKHSNEPVFELSSGKKSKYYFDLKKTTYSSGGQYLTGNLFYNKIIETGLNPDAAGGLTMGADPIASSIAYTSHLKGNPIEAFTIRKEPKRHGMLLQIEGNIKEGDNVMILDDVITTGGSTIKAIDIARRHGLNILAVIVLIDRCEENGRENIEDTGVKVYSILTINDFLKL